MRTLAPSRGSRLRSSASLAVMAIGVTMSNPAAAQAQASSSNAADSGEIIVTAQRRDESLQQVPISIVALSETTLKQSGIVQSDQLYLLTPALVQSNALRSVVTYIRGIGTQAAAPGEESEISTYVDGVYIASAQGARIDLSNVARVEILKGPQGTLFGRNSTGGLIQVVTKTPGSSPAVDAAVSYGNYQTISARLYGATPVSDTVGLNLSFAASRQDDGFGYNFTTGQSVNRTNSFSARSKIVWAPTDGVKWILAGDYSKLETDAGNVRQVYPGATLTLGVTAKGGFHDTQAGATTTPIPRDLLPYATQYGGSVTGKIDLGGVELNTISALRTYIANGAFDSDGGPLRLLDAGGKEITSTIQQEVFFSGESGRLQWTLGGIYLGIKARYDPLFIRTDTLSVDRYTNMKTNSFAGYGEGIYKIAADTRLTVGARYTFDSRKISGQQFNAAGLLLPYSCPVHGASPDPVTNVVPKVSTTRCVQSRNWGALSWKTVLAHDFSPDVMGYLSVSRGFKSGVFNLSAADALPVDPEKLTAYMAGLKTTLLNGRLRLNAEAFYYDYKNIQLTVPSAAGGTSIALFNAAGGTAKGIDLDASYRSKIGTSSLTLSSGISVLDAHYNDFPANICTTPRTVSPFGNIATACSGNGLTFIRAPKVSGTFAVDLSIPAGDGRVLVHSDIYHSGKFFWTSDNRLAQPEYSVINARLGYEFPKSNWRVELWAKNLADEKYFAEIKEDQAFGDQFTAQPPRTYGVTVAFEL